MEKKPLKKTFQNEFSKEVIEIIEKYNLNKNFLYVMSTDPIKENRIEISKKVPKEKMNMLEDDE